MTQMPRILVVDDDPVARSLIAAVTGKAGYRVDQAEDAAGLMAWLDHGGIDLVLLDVSLPDGNGFDLARRIRNQADVAIIMVTEKGAPDDRALGLEIGADDYLPKPVYPRELLARIKNVLERRGTLAAKGRGLGFSGYALDEVERRLTDPGGRGVELTPAEFDLLAVMVKRAGRVQSREQLMDALGSAETEAGPRSVDILVSRLRKKLGSEEMIETCRGLGYRFSAKVTKA